jgi:RHS repeat-associated protein
MTVGGNTLNFTYDAAGTPTSITYNDVTYYYVTNIQGDVLAIVDSSGTTVVQYTYDAWGNILSTSCSLADSLGAANPLRYRGYVYDAETGLYYLQSRYYDPEMGRFVNADAYASTGQGLLGNNMFAYCLNSLVGLTDACGCYPVYISSIRPAFFGQDTILTSETHPKDVPPDHPNFTPPKKGNSKKRNPNGKGHGWVDNKGNVWVWNPNMHGGEGWVVQEPDGGHSHAYPGGKTKEHCECITNQFILETFPQLQVGPNTTIFLPTIVGACAIGITFSYFISEGFVKGRV